MKRLPVAAGSDLTITDLRLAKGWNEASRARFLEVLEESANVSAAARAVHLTRRSAYMLRQRDPEFARQWQLALDIALDHLEAVLIDRVHNGVEKGVYVGGKLVGRELVFSDSLAINLLKRHRPAGFAEATQGQPASGDPEAFIAVVQERLDRLRKADTPETDDDDDQ
jgi:hypothetical protein